MRAVAMLISYEIPLALSILGVVLIAGSMQLSVIVDTQRYMPMILLQPLGFLIFVTAVSAELNRTPFDLLEAESELTTGYHVEYSGMKWGVFMLAEYAAAFAYSAVIATIFLSGWKGPLLPGFAWFAIKVVFLWLVFIWVRGTFPRLRVDQVMAFAWKFLVPLALLNVLITAVEVIIQAKAGWEHFPMWFAPINIGIGIALIVIMTKLFRFQGQTRQVVPRRQPSGMVMQPAPGKAR
jgi:NADH-quinone oxidoreductase subunit H